MNQILALREKRAKAWEAAKAFLESKRGTDGLLSAEDTATYDRMEADVVNLGKEIERLERQAAIDAELNKPTSHPITNQPGKGNGEEEKTGRASAAYKTAFWNAMRKKNYLDIQNALQVGTDSEGGYLVPDEYERTLVEALEEENFFRSLATVIQTSSGDRKIPIVELFAYLCKLYGLNPTADGVIISHREGHARGIASNHGDPEHLWNGLGMGYTMNTFRKDVKEKMQGGTVKPDETKEMYRVRKSWEDAVSQKGAFHELENAKKCADANKGYAVFNTSGKQVYPKTDFSPYLVEVTATDLNIRKGPGTNYGKTGKFTGKGVFTITEERAGTGSNRGWGKLKSGAGWISLDYVKRL